MVIATFGELVELLRSWNRLHLRSTSMVSSIIGTTENSYENQVPNMIILCRPGGNVTFFCANILILFLTTSIPRASEAFNSSTAFLYASPIKHMIL